MNGDGDILGTRRRLDPVIVEATSGATAVLSSGRGSLSQPQQHSKQASIGMSPLKRQRSVGGVSARGETEVCVYLYICRVLYG